MSTLAHNPDRYMSDLRRVLAQGRKRIGLLLGAGASASIKVDPKTREIKASIPEASKNEGKALIPMVKELTTQVLSALKPDQSKFVERVSGDLDSNPNIEQILSRLRSLSAVIGTNQFYETSALTIQQTVTAICKNIGNIVSVKLPPGPSAFTELAAWVGGTDRSHPVEIFTPNYDLLIEEALERTEIPYFDGFSGSHQPFFDPASIAKNDLPSRWCRIWKLHGSIGWTTSEDGRITRTGDRSSSNLIYPDHLKYDSVKKLPFSAFLDRLRSFLLTPDTLLVSCGFSFQDSHIVAVLNESLSANPAASVFAFQYQNLQDEGRATEIASKRTNLSVYASDGAQINCIPATWRPGTPPAKDWDAVRSGYWGPREGKASSVFLLGDFAAFCRFVAMIHTDSLKDEISLPAPEGAE